MRSLQKYLTLKNLKTLAIVIGVLWIVKKVSALLSAGEKFTSAINPFNWWKTASTPEAARESVSDGTSLAKGMFGLPGIVAMIGDLFKVGSSGKTAEQKKAEEAVAVKKSESPEVIQKRLTRAKMLHNTFVGDKGKLFKALQNQTIVGIQNDFSGAVTPNGKTYTYGKGTTVPRAKMFSFGITKLGMVVVCVNLNTPAQYAIINPDNWTLV